MFQELENAPHSLWGIWSQLTTSPLWSFRTISFSYLGHLLWDFSFDWSGIHYIEEDDTELLILLPPPVCWDCQQGPPYLGLNELHVC